MRTKLIEIQCAAERHAANLITVANGSPLSPDNLSRDWIRTCKTLDLPKVCFTLCGTRVSVLIDAGLDVVAISRRIGHSKPTVTLNTYGHLFKNTDAAAAAAIEAALSRTVM